MSDTLTTPPRTAETGSKRIMWLRRSCIAVLSLLIIESALGAAVSLYAAIPAADHNTGLGTAFARALSNPPANLAVHTAIGLLLVIGAVSAFARSIPTRRPAVIAASLIGLLAIIAAALSGAGFVSHGQASASMAMAAATAVAALAYLVNTVALSRGE